jgi:hypothetical protein
LTSDVIEVLFKVRECCNDLFLFFVFLCQFFVRFSVQPRILQPYARVRTSSVLCHPQQKLKLDCCLCEIKSQRNQACRTIKASISNSKH